MPGCFAQGKTFETKNLDLSEFPRVLTREGGPSCKVFPEAHDVITYSTWYVGDE